MSLAAIRFGNRLTPDRAGLVSSFQQLLPEHRPEFSEVVWKFVNHDPVGPGGSAVRFDSCPGTFEGVGVDNLLHEVQWNIVQGWLLDGRRVRVTGQGRRRAQVSLSDRAFRVFRSLLVAGSRFCMFRSVRVHRWFFLVKKRSVLPDSGGMRSSGTTTSADFCSHEPDHSGRPAFQASLTHGYADRSPRIRDVNFRCTSASTTTSPVGNGFVVLGPLASESSPPS
ncbi:hypothetical protein CA13_73960 [Planctomycetes bacterium CA13]|uniref:Uncharacterized protein n=1 Tax=Novipirellula herctigrandis TaxID=2527986 RepID=A0A5C5YIL7_9BACT|nr:hypothetical protein CA13_73960 [Planctomycetes bacterium CA13]